MRSEKIRLGVNVDHVATLRNQRQGNTYPDPVLAAVQAQEGGAHNITCHLREDRRHIRDADLRNLRTDERLTIPLNLEMAATEEMLSIALEIKPDMVTLVPEGRQELTTEGGLAKFDGFLLDMLPALRSRNITPILFIDPHFSWVEKAKHAGVQEVEFHVGDMCDALAADGANHESIQQEYTQVFTHAYDLGIKIHIGHGINFSNASFFRSFPHIETANVGHSLVAAAITLGMREAVSRMCQSLGGNG